MPGVLDSRENGSIGCVKGRPSMSVVPALTGPCSFNPGPCHLQALAGEQLVQLLVQAVQDLLQDKFVGNRMLPSAGWGTVAAGARAFPLLLGPSTEAVKHHARDEERLSAWVQEVGPLGMGYKQVAAPSIGHAQHGPAWAAQ